MQALYLDDSYLKEFDAEVVSVSDGKFIVLDRTGFYPNSGGQPYDEGIIVKASGEEFNVVFVGKFSGKISHEVDNHGLEIGDKVHCRIDWDRRYSLMKMHTASHILSNIINVRTGALITGNQLGIEKSRVDFNLENFDRLEFEKYLAEANSVIAQNMDVSVSYMPREEALKIPSMIKLAGALPPKVKNLRIVSIGDFDSQADGGTHVNNTSEIGKLKLVKVQNKGKNNRRLYFTIE